MEARSIDVSPHSVIQLIAFAEEALAIHHKKIESMNFQSKVTNLHHLDSSATWQISMFEMCITFMSRVATVREKVREKNIFFKIMEKSGNFATSQ